MNFETIINWLENKVNYCLSELSQRPGAGALKIQTVNPSGWTVPANSARGGEIKGTIDGYEGYTPMVVVCYCTNSYGVLIINAWVSGSYDSAGGGFTWNIDARNVTSSSVTANFTLRILWIKNDILG